MLQVEDFFFSHESLVREATIFEKKREQLCVSNNQLEKELFFGDDIKVSRCGKKTQLPIGGPMEVAYARHASEEYRQPW